MTYFNFTVLELENNIKVPNPNDIHFSKNIMENYYYIIVEDYPELFELRDVNVDKNTKKWWYPKFFDGWKNFPLVYFDEESYKKKEKCFKPYNPYTSEGIKKGIRRKQIDKSLSKKITLQTEIKKIRKVILAIINKNPELLGLQEVTDFVTYSSFIETEVKKKRKERINEYINLEKVNVNTEKL